MLKLDASGKVKMGSVYKLFAMSWFIGMTLLFGGLFLFVAVVMTIVGLVTGQITVNGEVQAVSLSNLAVPWVMVLFVPIGCAFHAVVFSAFLTLGAWLNSKRDKDFLKIADTE